MNDRRSNTPILVYHDIEPRFRLGSFNPTLTQFRSQMQYLKDAGFRTVTLAEALEGAREMLVSRTRRREAEELLSLITHTKPNELEEDFAYLVAENMYFE